MLEKIKSISLRWKFGCLIFVALLVVIVILLSSLRGFLNREFEALYGNPNTKGRFIAELLADELKPILKENIDAPEVQQIVDSYKDTYGIYGVRYIFLLDETNDVLVDTYKSRVPQSLIDLNPFSKEDPCKTFTSGEKRYHDCASPVQLSGEARGVLRVGLIEQNPDSQIWSTLKSEHVSSISQKMVGIAFGLIIVVTILLSLVVWYVFIRRITSISQATERMSFGDLDTVVDVKSQDEIGMLEDTLERMRANLKDAIERLKRRK